MARIILTGASTGIGKDLAIELNKRGHQLALTARRTELIEEYVSGWSNKPIVRKMDAGNHEESRLILGELIEQLGGLEVLVYNAGIGESSGKWEKEREMHMVNALGFAAQSNYAFRYFKEKGIPGHIVGVSSVAEVRGSRMAIGYCATKAFMSTYMEGQRNESVAKNLGITITDIRPGFIDTPMTKKNKGMFWLETSENAARDIARAIEQKKHVAYIPAKWVIPTWIMRLTPDYFWYRK